MSGPALHAFQLPATDGASTSSEDDDEESYSEMSTSGRQSPSETSTVAVHSATHSTFVPSASLKLSYVPGRKELFVMPRITQDLGSDKIPNTVFKDVEETILLLKSMYRLALEDKEKVGVDLSALEKTGAWMKKTFKESEAWTKNLNRCLFFEDPEEYLTDMEMKTAFIFWSELDRKRHERREKEMFLAMNASRGARAGDSKRGEL